MRDKWNRESGFGPGAARFDWSVPAAQRAASRDGMRPVRDGLVWRGCSGPDVPSANAPSGFRVWEKTPVTRVFSAGAGSPPAPVPVRDADDEFSFIIAWIGRAGRGGRMTDSAGK